MRILDFSDGYTSATQPDQGEVHATGLRAYADDASFVAANGPATEGDAYLNSTSHMIRYYSNGAWVDQLDVSTAQTVTNKTLATGSNHITGSIAKAAQFNAATGDLEASSVTNTELGYVSGVTSAIQTQLNGKQATGNYIAALTGDVTANGPGSAAATISAATVTGKLLTGLDTSLVGTVSATDSILQGIGRLQHQVSALSVTNLTVVTKTANYTLTSSDQVVLADATSGAFTLLLPAAASNSGKVFYIKKIDATANGITIDGNASELIDGELTQTMFDSMQAITLISDGGNWYVF